MKAYKIAMLVVSFWTGMVGCGSGTADDGTSLEHESPSTEDAFADDGAEFQDEYGVEEDDGDLSVSAQGANGGLAVVEVGKTYVHLTWWQNYSTSDWKLCYKKSWGFDDKCDSAEVFYSSPYPWSGNSAVIGGLKSGKKYKFVVYARKGGGWDKLDKLKVETR